VPRWIHSGVIPPCPCGASPKDQVRRTSGGASVFWHCLLCEQGRPAADGWTDPLIAVTETQWLLRNRRRQERAREREELHAHVASLVVAEEPEFGGFANDQECDVGQARGGRVADLR
jgi:hypothetical protein